MNCEFLYRLLEVSSVSGLEEEIQQEVIHYMKDSVDEIRTDDIGDVVCIFQPKQKKKVMLSAHIDEIGLLVTHITDQGMLHVIARGGVNPRLYPGHSVCVQGLQGPVYGTVQSHAELLKKEALSVGDLLIDIGAKDKEDALAWVKPGDSVVFDTEIRHLKNDRIAARGLDDKVGVYVIMEALKRVVERGCNVGVYAASTVGEETTKNGAYWSASRIQPDIAIVVDVTYTSDCLGMHVEETGEILLGGGPALCNNPLIPRKLNRQMEDCAKEHNIVVQYEAAPKLSYTDADQIHFTGAGVPVILVSIPLRYMHTPAEVADLKDVEQCIELIAQYIEKM